MPRVYWSAALAFAAIMLAIPSQAAYHLWNIRELYTDSSGSLQFVELFDSYGGQEFVNRQSISVANAGGTATHIYTFPTDLPGESFGHSLLLGTAGVQAAGGPRPDFIVPNGFLFLTGGSISFFNASGSYTGLPTDGVNSRTWGDGNAVNSPQNFAGQTGRIVAVPEASTWTLLLLGVGAFCWSGRRRSA